MPPRPGETPASDHPGEAALEKEGETGSLITYASAPLLL